MKLSEHLDGRMAFIELKSAGAEPALGEISASLSKVCSGCGERDIRGRLIEWMKAGSPGLSDGVALPHARCEGLGGSALCLARSGEGVDFGGGPGQPVRLVAAFLSPAAGRMGHLAMLARLARILRQSGVRDRLLEADGPGGMARVFREADEAASGNGPAGLE
ncbi:MAG: PTS sugar transporter subunit IIA [Myxococcota bacterium]|jgi:mannitol/fructose-specific phosphotransferase system IIA component (Ntr-type)